LIGFLRADAADSPLAVFAVCEPCRIASGSPERLTEMIAEAFGRIAGLPPFAS
jgi:hypothetical protein